MALLLEWSASWPSSNVGLGNENMKCQKLKSAYARKESLAFEAFGRMTSYELGRIGLTTFLDISRRTYAHESYVMVHEGAFRT